MTSTEIKFLRRKKKVTTNHVNNDMANFATNQALKYIQLFELSEDIALPKKQFSCLV